MKKIKKYWVFLLTICLFAGFFGMESHAAELEQYGGALPFFRLSLTKEKESMIYTAYYAMDSEGNIYLLTSAFVGAAMEDGWTATLHTSSGQMNVGHLKTENGVSYLKATVPGTYYMFKIPVDTSIDSASLIFANRAEKKIENIEDFTITSYVWSRQEIDFSQWLLHDGYHLWDDHYFAKNYLDEVKVFGAPLINISMTELFGTLYMDENYRPIIRDFRRTGLVKDAAIGKVEPDTVYVTARSNNLGAMDEEFVVNTDQLLKLEELEIVDLEDELFIEGEGQMISENRYLPVVIDAVAVIAAIFYIRKRKQKAS